MRRKRARRATYPVPAGVKEAAQKGLDLHREYSRGGTHVGLATARTLTTKRAISAAKVKHISRYFPRHAVDNLDQHDPPSNGYIAWLLWGGDPGRSWSTRIAKRLDSE